MCWTGPALAGWIVNPDGVWFSETPTAIGISTRRALSVTCSGGKPLIYTNGYLAQRGENRQDRFVVTVDGRDFAVTGEHSPGDGLWTGMPSAELIDALKNGRVAVVKPTGQPTARVSLKGSSKAINAALANCGSTSDVAAADAAPTAGGGKTVFAGHAIAQACGGRYDIADGAEFRGLLDLDDEPDFVLDWAGVTCADRSKGRGAGFCGAALCAIDILFTETRRTQQIFGINPEIVQRAFGKFALRTTTTGRSCGGPAQVCQMHWRWNGTQLEAMR